MTDEEIAVLRGLCSHQLALRAELKDEPRRRSANRQNTMICALDEADLACRQAEGRPLRFTKDYTTYKPDDAPSLSSVLRVYGTFERALADSGIAAIARPEADLVRIDGRPRGGGRSWTLEDGVEAMACVYEHFMGRRFSWDAYDEVREALGEAMPRAHQVTALATGELKLPALEEMRERAIAWILERPADYPKAYAYLSLTRTLRTEDVG